AIWRRLKIMENYSALPDCDWREFCGWLLGRRNRIVVSGLSMLPTLHPKQEILCDPRAFQNQDPTPGEIVVIQHPLQPDVQLVKRVRSQPEPNRFEIQGDNLAASTDSRDFGLIARSQIVGRVTCLFE
ncbi:MAG: nickel-type superoxide dismutase maturation protease, partial [Cyanobacteria bacterium P01_H01_bin.15]